MNFRSTPPRRRIPYAAAILGVIVIGLASRKFPELLPAAFGKYPGDVLWALMVFLIWATLFPRWPTLRIGAIALTNSYAVELLQIYQAPWITAVRATVPGHLVLGSTFHWPDLIAYTAGVALGVLGETLASGPGIKPGLPF